MPHPLDIIRRLYSVSDDVIDHMREFMVEEKVKKGYCIQCAPGFNNYVSYYIQTGAARTYYIDKGKESTFAFAFDDDFVLTHPLRRSGTPYGTMNIMFMEDTSLVTFRSKTMRDILHSSFQNAADTQEWTIFLNAMLYGYAVELEERIYYMSNASARERYEWVLRRYPRLTEVATLTQIASFLNVTKETLYRIRSGKYPG